jgi:outer membrane protein TolC
MPFLRLSRISAVLLIAAAALPCTAAAQRADTVRLSIEDAVTRAESQADITQTAALQLDITEAQLDIARSTAYPSLRLTSGYTYAPKSARAQVAGRNFSQRNTYTVSGTFNQPLFQGGRVFAGIRAANRLSAAARQVEADARATAAIEAQRAYLAVLLNDRLVNIQRANVQLASDRVVQVERLQTGGQAARYDVLRARVERANAEPLVLQAESDRTIALLELKVLLRIPLDQPIALTTRIDTIAVRTALATIAPDTIDPLVAAGSRASVRAAELTAAARRDAIAVARADLLPTVSGFVTGGYAAFPNNGFPTSFGRVDTSGVQNGGFFSDLSMGLAIGWNLFDGLRTKANIDLARAQSHLADLQLATERQTAALEIARAQAELTRARSFYGARQQAAAESRETFTLASLRFTRGLGTQLDVSDAQLAQLTAETNEARAAFDLYLAAAELARSIGRPVPLPPTVRAPLRSTSMTDVRDSIATH